MESWLLSRVGTDEDPKPMIPTFVYGYPTGQETGAYLAVDLGELKTIFSKLQNLIRTFFRRNQFKSLSC